MNLTDNEFKYCLHILDICRANKKKHGFNSSKQWMQSHKSINGSYGEQFLIQYRSIDFIIYENGKLHFGADKYMTNVWVGNKLISSPKYCDLDITSEDFTNKIKLERDKIDVICNRVIKHLRKENE